MWWATAILNTSSSRSSGSPWPTLPSTPWCISVWTPSKISFLFSFLTIVSPHQTWHTKHYNTYLQVSFLFEENIVHNISRVFESLQKELIIGKFIIWKWFQEMSNKTNYAINIFTVTSEDHKLSLRSDLDWAESLSRACPYMIKVKPLMSI